MANSSTPFSSRCEILADLWSNYRDEEEFQDFIRYSDLGLPFAYGVSTEILFVDDPDSPAYQIIDETWDLFISGLGLKDIGFETLDDILTLAIAKNKDNE